MGAASIGLQPGCVAGNFVVLRTTNWPAQTTL